MAVFVGHAGAGGGGSGELVAEQYSLALNANETKTQTAQCNPVFVLAWSSGAADSAKFVGDGRTVTVGSTQCTFSATNKQVQVHNNNPMSVQTADFAFIGTK